jgi:hypothetical protein
VSNLEVFSLPPLVFSFDQPAQARSRATKTDPSRRTAWALRRSQDAARCVLCTVGDRIELHISMTHDVVMSQQCIGPDQAAAISNAWRVALINRGWIEEHADVTIKAKPDRRASERTS